MATRPGREIRLKDASRLVAGRRKNKGRRANVCAAPVVVESGWAPKVIAKSDDELKSIYNCVGQCFLFKNLESADLDVVVGAMERKSFKKGDVIIKQHDVGDFFYVVEGGKCDIDVDGTWVCSVESGGSFGELALMYDSPRAATVVAASDVVTFALDQITFKKTLMDTAIRRRQKFEEFLSEVPLLSGLGSYERSTLADALQTVYANSGDVIIREGDTGDVFYMIEEGEVRCTKESSGGREVCPRLKRGSYFGEIALLTADSRRASVTAVKPCKFQTVDRLTFKRLLGPLESLLLSNMGMYSKYEAYFQSASESKREDGMLADEIEEDDEEDEAFEGKE